MPLLYGDQMTLALTEKVWAYLRVYMGEWVVVVLNTGDRTEKMSCVLPKGIDRRQAVESNFGHAFTLEEDGTLTVEVQPYSFEILTAK